MTDNKKYDVEIESLNLDDLDVEELDHRLEMTVIGPPITNGCQENTGGCYINA
jgi:hypothetical protein